MISPMRYELHAMVASPEALAPIVDRFRHIRPTLLDGGDLALVPVCGELFAEIDLEGFPVDPESGFERLSSGLAAVLTAASRYGPIAYLETDYTGGLGWQTAAVWLDCYPVFGPSLLRRDEPFPVAEGPMLGGSPIVQALRYLGVQSVGRYDPFVVLGLGRHPSTDDWCEAWTAR